MSLASQSNDHSCQWYGPDGRLEGGRVPLAFAGEADLDACHGPVPDQALPRTVQVPGRWSIRRPGR